MKPLNIKERNSAILRFSLWLFICVLIISLPVVLSLLLPGEKKKFVNAESQGELAQLTREARYEKDTLALQIRTILELMKKVDLDKTKIETFNAELMNVVKDIESQTKLKNNWRGEMYKNISAISAYLIEANKILNEDRNNKEKQSGKLDNIILEFETCGEEIGSLLNEKSKRDFHSGINKVDVHFKKAMKMLNAAR
jgi:hypothetical protein